MTASDSEEETSDDESDDEPDDESIGDETTSEVAKSERVSSLVHDDCGDDEDSTKVFGASFSPKGLVEVFVKGFNHHLKGPDGGIEGCSIAKYAYKQIMTIHKAMDSPYGMIDYFKGKDDQVVVGAKDTGDSTAHNRNEKIQARYLHEKCS